MERFDINIILKEKEYAEKILKESKLSKKPSYDLRIVAKYLYHVENLKPNQIYKRLVAIMEEKYYNFSIAQWQDLLLDISKRAKKRDLINIEYIPVTKNELLTIDNIKSKPMKRIAFTMLCLAKYRNKVNENNRDWINYDFKDIFRMANVAATIKEQCFMIHDMKALGLIKMNKMVNNLSLNICYIDKTGAEEVLKISDFRNLGYEYLLYCGEKFFRCKRCGVLSRQNKFESKVYCNECAKLSDYDPIGTKIIQCIDCGCDVTVDAKDTKTERCEQCYKKYRHNRKLETQRIRRKKKNEVRPI